MVARATRRAGPMPGKGAVALIADGAGSGNAGEMGWNRKQKQPQPRPICRPAALVCRSFYFFRQRRRPVNTLSRSAATGTLNAY